jgi:hypothetical protein
MSTFWKLYLLLILDLLAGWCSEIVGDLFVVYVSLEVWLWFFVVGKVFDR